MKEKCVLWQWRGQRTQILIRQELISASFSCEPVMQHLGSLTTFMNPKMTEGLGTFSCSGDLLDQWDNHSICNSESIQNSR